MYMQTSTYQQVNHYYPYGGLMGESTGDDVQRFKYNGKELNRMHGLDWYDYGARHYDSAIVSWPTTDPLCEKYYSISPYVSCGGNPINAIDIDGNLIIFINGWHNGFEGESHKYWVTEVGNFDDLVMNHFNDYNVLYYDGALGGL